MDPNVKVSPDPPAAQLGEISGDRLYRVRRDSFRNPPTGGFVSGSIDERLKKGVNMDNMGGKYCNILHYLTNNFAYSYGDGSCPMSCI